MEPRTKSITIEINFLKGEADDEEVEEDKGIEGDSVLVGSALWSCACSDSMANTLRVMKPLALFQYRLGILTESHSAILSTPWRSTIDISLMSVLLLRIKLTLNGVSGVLCSKYLVV